MTKKIGVAFGGSGAEGIANIAYVRALEEMGVTPAIVSGTGIGGVIAAMYAAGMTGDEMVAFMEEIDFPGAKRPINAAKVKDFKYGILDGMGLEEYFQMIVPVKVFDRLYFGLKIAAANYASGQPVIFDSGNVGTAVRAGVSVPGIFSPHEKDEVLYLDGSCVNPVPFDIIRGDCDVLVCIDPQITHDDESADDLSPFVFPALNGAFEAAKKALVAQKRESCEVELFETVAVKGVTTYDFAQHEFILQTAGEMTEKFKTRLKKCL